MPKPNKPLARRLFLALIASMVVVASNGQAKAPVQPKLLVGIVVEGLQQEYIDLLRQYLTAGGFNRLLGDGAVVLNVDYGTNLDPTAATAVIFTGAAPSVTGISGAEVFDRDTRRAAAVLTDANTMGNYTSQTFSPKDLGVSTIADEVRIAGGGVTYAYAIAPEPAEAVIMAGHAGNCGIWLNQHTGNWATTTFYKDVPSALTSANRLRPLSARLDTMSWTPLMPSDRYVLLPDHLTRYPFRYIFRSDRDKMAIFRNSPMFNSEVTSLAIDHINSLSLGQHDGTDMLSVVYSLEPFAYSKGADNRYELYDSYYRLDRDLDRLFSAVDKGVGMDQAVIFLAGTPRPARSRRDDEKWQMPTGEFSCRKAISLLNMYLMALHGNGEWVTGYHNGEFFLNHKLIKDRKKDLAQMRIEAADFLSRMSGVTNVYTVDDIIGGRAGVDSQAMRRNLSLPHAGDVRITVFPGWEIVDNDFSTGGLPNQVVRSAQPTAPLYILAPDLASQRIDYMVDARAIAPTVAGLLHIRSPNAATVPPLRLSRK